MTSFNAHPYPKTHFVTRDSTVTLCGRDAKAYWCCTSRPDVTCKSCLLALKGSLTHTHRSE